MVTVPVVVPVAVPVPSLRVYSKPAPVPASPVEVKVYFAIGGVVGNGSVGGCYFAAVVAVEIDTSDLGNRSAHRRPCRCRLREDRPGEG